MTDRRDEKHRYGQHYTPERVARLLAAFAVQSPSDLILDPACGDGRLLGEAGRRKKLLSANRRLPCDLFGFDRSAKAVRSAKIAGARVECKDFFDIEPVDFVPAAFDAVIGNPPYIRHEVMGREDKRRIEKRMEAGRAHSPEIFWPRWSGRSDIYVFFFAHAARFLKPGGRLVFLTAASWLDSGYGARLREFLLKNFRVVAVIESGVESFFDDASINTAITVLEREGEEGARAQNIVRFVQLLRPLDEIFSSNGSDDAGRLADWVREARSSVNLSTHRVRVIRQSELLDERAGGAAWGKYLRADDLYLEMLGRGGARMGHLSDVARVRFGVKTGANEFFYLREADRKGSELSALNRLARVRRGLTTGANEFFYLREIDRDRKRQRNGARLTVVENGIGARYLIESKYLAPVLFSLKEIAGFVVEKKLTRKLFFHCAAPRSSLAGTHALRYIQAGERMGYHLRPTCASRPDWYTVAAGFTPAPIIFPSKVGERWVVALNRARVFEDKKLYGVFPKDNDCVLALAALLNSTWARYSAEITCRQMTGAQAIADIDVQVAEQIPIPDPRKLPAPLKKKLEAAFLALAQRKALSVFEEVRRADRRRLDELTLEAMGLNRSERKAAIERLYAAVLDLVRRRLARSSAD
jgi:SAM-dependent methyltransferase